MWSQLFMVGVLAAGDSASLRRSIEQLREHRGRWNVETEFLNVDKSVARRATGTYRFDWALEDRILVGVSEIPELKSASGVLFYVAPGRNVIEMTTVGNDGMLWTMTGPLGGEVRQSQPFRTQGGGEARLRFTRYNVTPDSFESRMEYTEDAGKTWLPGNHQTFRRAAGPRESSYGLVSRLGNDTVIVERVTVGDSVTTVDMFEVSPRAALTHYEVHRDRQGRVRAIRFSARALTASATARPLNQRVEVDGDSATVTILRGDSVVAGPLRVAATHPIAPWLLSSAASYEMLMSEARRSAADSAIVTAWSLGVPRPSRLLARRLDQTRFAVAPFREDQRVIGTFNAAGEMERLSGKETTVKVEVDRTGPLLEFDRLVERFVERERIAGRGAALSPRDSVRATLLGAQIAIDYGRPYARGRTILGAIVPWDTVWRTGANTATRLQLSAPLLFGDLEVPAGSYTLFTLPRRNGPLLIINKQTGQWGTAYDATQDLGRAAMVATTPSAITEQVTITVLETGPDSGVLRISWGTFQWDVRIRRPTGRT
ncbi:MAG: DUF2911 domain-containing protein [Gemmatimonadales bacterium]|nr:DUF2911 domain-containing protein [Gemmatimonadales bacterium]